MIRKNRLNKIFIIVSLLISLTLILYSILRALETNIDLYLTPTQVESGEYNIDTEVSTLKAEVGKTISLGALSITADADFDIIGTAFSGTDYKAEMSVPGASGLELYVKSGLDKSWKREDIIAGVTFSW